MDFLEVCKLVLEHQLKGEATAALLNVIQQEEKRRYEEEPTELEKTGVDTTRGRDGL